MSKTTFAMLAALMLCFTGDPLAKGLTIGHILTIQVEMKTLVEQCGATILQEGDLQPKEGVRPFNPHTEMVRSAIYLTEADQGGLIFERKSIRLWRDCQPLNQMKIMHMGEHIPIEIRVLGFDAKTYHAKGMESHSTHK